MGAEKGATNLSLTVNKIWGGWVFRTYFPSLPLAKGIITFRLREVGAPQSAPGTGTRSLSRREKVRICRDFKGLGGGW